MLGHPEGAGSLSIFGLFRFIEDFALRKTYVTWVFLGKRQFSLHFGRISCHFPRFLTKNLRLVVVVVVVLRKTDITLVVVAAVVVVVAAAIVLLVLLVVVVSRIIFL